ncbi:toprim domain-containing protein [Ruminococcus sp. CAG:330]|nr:toprim domain-containing protein [Ruminococcus sp. CAG:330]CDE12869.1 dNA primase [Ruminococcus sp. CAG:330]
MDVIAINQAGFSNVVATLGTAITPEQARKISNYAKEVIIAYDSDGAGQTATQKAIRHFSEVGLPTRILHMSGAKDPDEYIKRFGPERFRLLLEQAGDAINFQLERCEEGLDVATDAGKVQLLKRTVSVLADIPDPIQQEIYLSRTANKWEISADVLRQQVAYRQRSKKKIEEEKAWRSIMEHTANPDPQIPQASAHLKEVKAEERILYDLLRYPEEGDWISQELTEAEFLTPLYQQVYRIFLACRNSDGVFTLSSLSGELSNDEMGKISGILAKYQDFPVSKKEIQDCIHTLKSSDSGEVETDDDLLSLVQKKAHKT